MCALIPRVIATRFCAGSWPRTRRATSDDLRGIRTVYRSEIRPESRVGGGSKFDSCDG